MEIHIKLLGDKNVGRSDWYSSRSN